MAAEHSGRPRPIRDWLDARTGYRAALHQLLDEELPAGVGWWFVTGSVALFLLGLQFLTGVILALYYVPSPQFAYDSVRFIMERLAFGNILRGLHVFGASFIVVAAVVHMLRVVVLGSYKKPRELTWLVGVVLLLVIFGFALTGYLLPWDQKAYWATTVTINIARSTPLVGEWVAVLLRGGADLGALTLLRWYAAHVLLLPAALIGLTLAHLFLMRRHSISGPIAPASGVAQPFYPHHALRDTLVSAAVFGVLLTLAIVRPAELDAIADPFDATYVPRPEWYFLALFELLKYFPGPFEPIATMILPGAVVLALLLLPFLDRRAERRLRQRPGVAAGFAALAIAVSTLTLVGLKTSPERTPASHQGLIAVAGRQFAQDAGCRQCHRAGAVASPIGNARPQRDPEWLAGHVVDPEIIAPGVRPAPNAGMDEGRIRAIIRYLQTLRTGTIVPVTDPELETAARVFAGSCVFCHSIDGEGGTIGPDLTHVGRTRDARWLREWISDPAESAGRAIAVSMPAFGERLSDVEIDAISNYLARRK